MLVPSIYKGTKIWVHTGHVIHDKVHRLPLPSKISDKYLYCIKTVHSTRSIKMEKLDISKPHGKCQLIDFVVYSLLLCSPTLPYCSPTRLVMLVHVCLEKLSLTSLPVHGTQ